MLFVAFKNLPIMHLKDLHFAVELFIIALEVFLNDMRYLNLRFYLLTYLLTYLFIYLSTISLLCRLPLLA